MKRNLLILAIILFIGLIVNSCGGDEEQPKLTCSEACTESQDNHLGRNDNGTLATCDHNDKTIQGECDCIEQTAVIAGTVIQISKAAAVSVAQMDAAVIKINEAYKDGLAGGEKTTFQAKVSKVHVISGSAASFSMGVWSIGYNATFDTIVNSLDDVLTMLQLQTKSTWLADKENKDREWV